jgi:hypothetical protein
MSMDHPGIYFLCFNTNEERRGFLVFAMYFLRSVRIEIKLLGRYFLSLLTCFLPSSPGCSILNNAD